MSYDPRASVISKEVKDIVHIRDNKTWTSYGGRHVGLHKLKHSGIQVHRLCTLCSFYNIYITQILAQTTIYTINRCIEPQNSDFKGRVRNAVEDIASKNHPVAP